MPFTIFQFSHTYILSRDFSHLENLSIAFALCGRNNQAFEIWNFFHVKKNIYSVPNFIRMYLHIRPENIQMNCS